LAPVVAEARRLGGQNKAISKRVRKLLLAAGLWEVFEGAMGALSRLERGEMTPQEAVAAAQLLRLALEIVRTAHALALPQALKEPPKPKEEGALEEKRAQLIARAAQILAEHYPGAQRPSGDAPEDAAGGDGLSPNGQHISWAKDEPMVPPPSPPRVGARVIT